MTIAVTMAKLLVAMLIGFYLGKSGVIDHETKNKMSTLVLMFTSPALCIASVTTIKERNDHLVLTLLLIGLVLYLVLPLIGWIVAKTLRVGKDLTGTYACMIIFSNTAFMGYPVVQALFGDEAIFYTLIMHMPFNILFYSLALYLFAKDAGKGSKFDVRKLINTGFISGLLALLIYFLNWNMPALIAEPLKFIGNITMPLSMIIIGASISTYALKEVFGDFRMYLLSIIRLILIPVMVYGIVSLMTDNQMVVQVATIIGGMPVASMVAMGSAEYENQGRHAALAVALTTIFSMITIPLVAMALGI
jgi:malate permease and related proteins